VTSGARIRWRAECPLCGAYFETEAKPKGAWCSKCGGKRLEITAVRKDS
jgi:rRNA maturation endonuclease Nob1